MQLQKDFDLIVLYVTPPMKCSYGIHRDFLYIHCIGYFDLVCFYLRFFQNVKNSCLLTSSHQHIKSDSWVKLVVNNDVNNSEDVNILEINKA